MNRLVCTNLDPIPPDSLPPARRHGPARILFINSGNFGFATAAANLQHYTATRDDIDAVHFNVTMPFWLRVACSRPVLNLPRLDVHGLRALPAWRLFLERWLAGPLAADRFDVIHVFTQQRALVARRFSAQPGGAGPKFVINIDATSPAWHRAFGKPGAPPRWDAGLERAAFRAAAAVACWSRWAADSVVNDFGIDPARVFLHRPCPRLLPGLPERPPPAPGRPLRLVFVGNDWQRKGGPRLLRWHQQRWADRAELHICSGAATPDPTARNVTWHGATPHDRLMRDILPGMDLFVMPTTQDTYLIAAQEAQAMGLPVVTSRLAGIPEFILHGQTGFLCDPADDDAFIAAVERLLADSDLRARMGRAARRHAERDLNPDAWHHHALDQLVAVADGRPLRTDAPAAPQPATP